MPVDEKELARYGYTGFHPKPPPDPDTAGVKGVTLQESGYRGFDVPGAQPPGTTTTISADDLDSLSKQELVSLASVYGLDVKPKGKRATPLKSDYLKALKKAVGA